MLLAIVDQVSSIQSELFTTAPPTIAEGPATSVSEGIISEVLQLVYHILPYNVVIFEGVKFCEVLNFTDYNLEQCL